MYCQLPNLRNEIDINKNFIIRNFLVKTFKLQKDATKRIKKLSKSNHTCKTHHQSYRLRNQFSENLPGMLSAKPRVVHSSRASLC